MNKLLSLSLSISIMFFTSYAGYYIWKEDKAKTEKEED